MILSDSPEAKVREEGSETMDAVEHQLLQVVSLEGKLEIGLAGQEGTAS
jgi:hypothetical protein